MLSFHFLGGIAQSVKTITVNWFDYSTNTVPHSTHFLLPTFTIIGSVSFNLRKEVFSAFVSMRVEKTQKQKISKSRKMKGKRRMQRKRA